MEVILREDVAHLGKAGEIVKVRDGYGRNFLIPRGFAFHASEGTRRQIEAEAKRRTDRQASDKQTAEALAARLANASISFTVKAGEGDKLFGSITTGDIAGKLKEQGFSIDKRAIELPEPLKMIGVYTVPVRLHTDVHAQLRVWVVKE